MLARPCQIHSTWTGCPCLEGSSSPLPHSLDVRKPHCFTGNKTARWGGRSTREHWQGSYYLHSGAAVGPTAWTSLKRDFKSGREIHYSYNMHWDVQMSQKCLLLWPSQWSILPHCFLVLLLSTCLYAPLTASWKLQELWDMAMVPALQGLGLDLAFPSAYGNLEIIRINTKIILASLRKKKKKEKELMSMISVIN